MKFRPNPVNMKKMTLHTRNSFSSGVQKGLDFLHTGWMRSATQTKFRSIDGQRKRTGLKRVGSPSRERAYMVISPTNAFTKSNAHKRHLMVGTSLTLTPSIIAFTPNGNKRIYVR